jgi:exopolysaccharide biosynthesis polyprenyl glycosylphosphotransferase
MKRSEIFFDAVLLPLDFLAIVVASIGVYAIRVSPAVRALRPVLFEVDLPLREFVVLVVMIAIATLVIFAALGLYAMEVTRRPIDEFTRIVAGMTLAAMGIILWMFLRSAIFESRFILVGAWLSSILLVTLARYGIRTVQIRLLERHVGAHRVVVVGATPVADHIAEQLRKFKRIGYLVSAHLEMVDRSELERIQQQQGIDEVIQCDPGLPESENLALLDFCEEYKIEYKYVPNLYSTLVSNVRTRTLAGYPVVELRRTPLDGWGRVVKRGIDLVGAVAGMIVLAPLFAFIAFFIAWDTPGPIFFRQVRIGRYRQPFRILKFRTMVKDAEALKRTLRGRNERQGPLFKMREDPRVTRVGKILRRMRVDELPQLWNVLQNDMSLIGPRPHLPEEISQYRKEHRKLFTLKPGMTGIAQVAGSSNLSFEEEATLDIQYIEQWSLKLDLQILLKTFWKLLWDRSAV